MYQTVYYIYYGASRYKIVSGIYIFSVELTGNVQREDVEFDTP